MNARKILRLPDTQSLPDLRRLPIQKVGVKDLRYPIARPHARRRHAADDRRAAR